MMDKKQTPKFIKKVLDRRGLSRLEDRSRPPKKPIKEKKGFKKELDNNLVNIYQDYDGKIPDMSKIDRRQRGRLRSLLTTIIIFLAFLAGISWAGFFIFRPDQDFSGEGVKLEIKAPSNITSGEDIAYTINYANLESVPLGNAVLDVRYPENFVYQEAFPAPTEENIYIQGGPGARWSLGTLKRNTNSQIIIHGQIIDQIDSKHDLRAIMNYKPANFNAEFQEIANYTLQIGESSLALTVEGPERILPDKDAEYIIKFKNDSSDDMENIKLIVVYPEDFVRQLAEPKSKENREGSEVWEIGKMIAQKEEAIKITGKFKLEARGAKNLKIQIGTLRDEVFYLQQEKDFVVEVVQGDLVVTLAINDSPRDGQANFGETLAYTINFKNNGKDEMGSLEISATLNSNVLDWGSLKNNSNGLVEGNKITWTERQVPGLKLLKLEEEGKIGFSIKIKDKKFVNDFSVLQIESKIATTIGKMDELEVKSGVEGNTIVTKINTDLILDSSGGYYDSAGGEVGTGPVPPKVGQTTTYRIFWDLTNSLHEVVNIKVTAALPGSVKWTGQHRISAGEMKYDSETRTISWTVNRFPTSIDKLTAYFDVGVTPETEDAGKAITLLPSILLTARDTKTGGSLSRIGKPIATEAVGRLF